MRLVLSTSGNLADDIEKEVSLSGKERFVIGRDKQANWVLLDAAKSISATHCEIIFDGSEYVLRDISTNGTFLNGSKDRLEHPHSLREGDTISVGPYVIKATTAKAGAAAGLAPAKPPESAPPSPSMLRGGVSRGDPAAMVSAPPIAPAKPEVADAHGDMTKISPAPKPTAPAPRGEPVAVKAPAVPFPSPNPPVAEPAAEAATIAPPVAISKPVVAPAPRTPVAAPISWTESATDNSTAGALLKGFGLEADAFPGVAPEEVAERLGALTRGLLAGLKDALDEAARSRRALGSRRRSTPRGQRGNTLKFSARAEEALLLLASLSPADAAAETKSYFDELKDHQRAVLSASQAAARSLGEELDPKVLADASNNVGSVMERKARLWDTYSALWHGFDADWPSGLTENFKVLMASHYDDQNKS